MGIRATSVQQGDIDTHSHKFREASNLNLIKSLLINVQLIEIKVCVCVGMRYSPDF